MAVVKATPNQFLLVGRGSGLENLGSARQAFLRPGTIWVLVPSGKHEATFEFTQETNDCIPLRFKGIIVFRITDPVAAARQFDFAGGTGIAEISTLLTHVTLGELRDAVSHKTMLECIEERKTTLSKVVEAALASAIASRDDGDWGVSIEVAQVAQVFIVDVDLRRQLEAEVRNEIKLRSDQSDQHALEETRLMQLASDSRVAEQQLAVERETQRREEELDHTRVERQRRQATASLVSAQQALGIERERFQAQMEAEQDRLATESPVRLLKIEREVEVLRRELEMRRLQNEVRALDVEHELMLSRGQQELRLEILPIEQAPQIVEAASKVLNGTNLSIYGEDGQFVGRLAPVFDVLARAIERATGQSAPLSSSSGPDLQVDD